MPAVPSCIIEPIWDQFQFLIPAATYTHPLGCHRPRVADRVIFDKLVQVFVLGAAYEKVADTRTWPWTGALPKPRAVARPPGGPEVDHGKQGTKRSVLVEGAGIPLGTVVAAANRHAPPLLRPTLETLGRFGFDLPQRITVHLDAGYDSKATRELLEELGCDAEIAVKGVPAPIQNTARWVVERTNS